MQGQRPLRMIPRSCQLPQFMPVQPIRTTCYVSAVCNQCRTSGIAGASLALNNVPNSVSRWLFISVVHGGVRSKLFNRPFKYRVIIESCSPVNLWWPVIYQCIATLCPVWKWCTGKFTWWSCKNSGPPLLIDTGVPETDPFCVPCMSALLFMWLS